MHTLQVVAVVVGLGFLVAAAFDKHIRTTHSGWVGGALISGAILIPQIV